MPQIDPPQLVKSHSFTTTNAVGTFHLPNNDVVSTALANGVFEPWVVDFITQHAKPGTAVIDVGANFGQMSLAASKAVGASGKVYAIETNDMIVEYLRATVGLNDFANNIEILHNACWETSGIEMRMIGSGGPVSGMGVLAQGFDPREANHLWYAVPSLAIDDIGIELPVSVIKVDIQGADLFALRGAKNIIARDKPILLFEYEYIYDTVHGISFQSYRDFLDEIDYEIRGSLCDNEHDFYCCHKDSEL